MYKYLVYGTGVHSDVKLYNLIETEVTADITIKFGCISREELPDDYLDFYYSDKYVCFTTPNTSFAIRDGKEIIVEKGEQYDEIDTASNIIGWCFAFVFSQRGCSAIHCTALNIKGQGVLVSGVSGAGKSTTATELINRGHKYLVDDIAMIDPVNGMKIVPAFPLQKICGDGVDKIDKSLLMYIDEDRDKYAYLNQKDFYDKPLPLKYVICLDVGDVNKVKVEEITGLDLHLNMLSCLFLAELYSFYGTPVADKFRCLKMSGGIKMYKITRPLEGNTLKEVTDAIEMTVVEEAE